LATCFGHVTGSLNTRLTGVSVCARLTNPAEALTTIASLASAHTGKSAVEFPA
jgi:hypothetical protein